jgi:hypothetical protein
MVVNNLVRGNFMHVIVMSYKKYVQILNKLSMHDIVSYVPR